VVGITDSRVERYQLIAMQLDPGGNSLDEANDVLGCDLHHYPPVGSKQ
jgi:hypothetical protein